MVIVPEIYRHGYLFLFSLDKTPYSKQLILKSWNRLTISDGCNCGVRAGKVKCAARWKSCCTSRGQKRHYEWHHSFETSRPTPSDLYHSTRPQSLILPKHNFNWEPNMSLWDCSHSNHHRNVMVNMNGHFDSIILEKWNGYFYEKFCRIGWLKWENPT